MKQGLIVIALIVLFVLGGIAWYFHDYGKPDAPPQPTAAEVAPEPFEPVVPEPEEPAFTVDEKRMPAAPELEALPLPPLHESDEYAQGSLAGVVGQANAMQYFASEALIARAVATVDALGSRQVPGNIQAVAGPEGGYAAQPDPDPPTEIRNEQGDLMPQYLSDPANHRRYYPFVEMFMAIDAEQFAALYRRNYPLFQQAWRELGYTDGTFGDRMEEVIDELLATPLVEEPYRLVKPEAVYLFADPELESLTAGQKILLRMGNANAARVKSKLSELRQAL